MNKRVFLSSLLALLGPIAMWAQDPCCDFAGDIAAGWQVSYPDPSNPCLVRVCAPQFFDDNCVEQIPYQGLDWGDGSPMLPAFSDLQMCYEHEYDASGTYVVGTVIYRYDAAGNVCGSDSMYTVVEVSCGVSNDSCCSNFADFEDKLAQGWQVSVDGCTVTVCAPQFEGDCYFLSESDLSWGDGNVTNPVLTPFEGCYTHTYSAGGPYVISGNICEVDAAGQPCWCKPMEVTISLDCGTQTDTCCTDRNAFEDKIAEGWQVNVDGCEVAICAPQFDSGCYVLTWSGLDWGDGTPNLPVVTPFEGCYSHTYESPGVYDISATICEQSADGCICWCAPMNVTVEVACPPESCYADTLAFYDRVDDGFDVIADGCCITAVPKSLNECDVITEWCVDGLCVPGPFDPADGLTWCFDQSGMHEVCMRVAMFDSLTGAICADTLFCDSIFVNCQQGCPCGPWDIAAVLTDTHTPDTIQHFPVACGDTISFDCPWEQLVFAGSMSCLATPTWLCLPDLLFYTLEDPSGALIASGTLSGNSFHIAFSAATFAVPGTWELRLVGTCGGQKCICRIYIVRPDCGGATGCCTDPQSFHQRVQQGFAWSASECCISATPNALSDCDRVTQWCWGDGHCDTGLFAPDQTLTHCYDTSGSYELCMYVVELDTATGAPCWEAVYCDTVAVSCAPECTCDWTLNISGGGQSWSPACGESIELPCPFSDLTVTGMLQCVSDPPTPNCAAWPEVQWKLDRPDPLGDLSGTVPPAGFSFSLPASAFAQAGDYTLELSGLCGGDTCVCGVKLVVPSCPPVGTDEPEWLGAIELAPNPAADQIRLHLPANGHWQGWTAELRAVTGQLILTRSLHDPTTLFHLAKLPDGVYRLALRDDKGIVRWTEQFIKLE